MDRTDQLEKQVENIWKELIDVQIRFGNLESWVRSNINHANVASPFQSHPFPELKKQTLAPGPSEASRVSPNAKDASRTTRIQPQSLPTITRGAVEAESKVQVTPGNRGSSTTLKVESGSDNETVTAKMETPKAGIKGKGLPPSSSSIPVRATPKSSANYTPRKVTNPEVTSAYTSSPLPYLKHPATLTIRSFAKTEMEKSQDKERAKVNLVTDPPSGASSQGVSSTIPTKPSRKSVYCKKCLIFFPGNKFYTLHKTTVHLKFACKYCSNLKRFEERAALIQHINSVHLHPKVSLKKARISGGKGKTNPQLWKLTGGNDIFVPPTIQQSQTKSSATLNFNHLNGNYGQDIKTHSTNCVNPFCCHQCRKTFQHPKHLKQHLQTH